MDDDRRLIGAISSLALTAFLVAGGCVAPYKVGNTATSFMNVIRTDPDPNMRHAAYGKLANPQVFESDAQRDEAARLLAKAILDGKEPVASRAVICRTLGEMRRPIGREAILRAIDDVEPLVRTEACRALGKVGQPDDATVLARIMAADTGCKDCQVAAIEGLGFLKSPDPRIELVLVEGMESEDPSIRLASVKALRDTTGKDLGIEPAPWRRDAQARIDPEKIAKTSAKDDKAVNKTKWWGPWVR